MHHMRLHGKHSFTVSPNPNLHEINLLTIFLQTPTKDSLAVHLGYKHSMFVQFLPKEVSERYRIFAESASLKDATVEPSNGETRTDENRHECQKCKKRYKKQPFVRKLFRKKCI